MIDLTPRTPYRQRTGILFGAVMIGHLILISAQVQSKAGVPVLEGVTFGVFSRFQGGAAGILRGIGGTWNSYFALRGVRAENESLRQQVADLEVRLQEQRALALRAERLQATLGLRESTTLPTLAAEIIAGNPNPGLMTVTVNRGSADGVEAGHGGDRPQRRRRARHRPGGVARRPGAAHDRPERGRGRGHRTDARWGDGGRR